jgi:hypothetical protein
MYGEVSCYCKLINVDELSWQIFSLRKDYVIGAKSEFLYDKVVCNIEMKIVNNYTWLARDK